MKKRIFYLSIFLLSLITILSNTELVSADSKNLTFSMSIVPPDNQINKESTYFDLLVNTGENQKLQLNVSNISKKKETIRVTPTNAITNSSGVVDYSNQAKDYEYDKTLKTRFTSLISGEQEVEIEAGETKTLTFDLKTPSEKFDGIILGGFLASLVEDEKDNNKQKSVSFINKFQIVKAVVIKNSEKEIKPELTLNEVKPNLYNYRTAITANLQNVTPVLLKPVSITAEVSKATSTKIIKSELRKDIEIAPNSNFNFPIIWGNEPLEAGEYSLNMKVVTSNEEFVFDSDFTISKEDSYRINKEAINIEQNPNNNIIWIALFILLAIIIFSLLFIIYRKNKNDKNKNSKNKNSKNKNSKNKNNKSKKKHN